MGAYFIRRFLLIPLTFVGITLMVFAITRLAPGGPMDALKAARQAGEAGKRGAKEEMARTVAWQQTLDDQERFDFHKSIPVAYLRWFGVLPREVKVAREEIPAGQNEVEVALSGSGKLVKVLVEQEQVVSSTMVADGTPLGSEWTVRVETVAELQGRWLDAMGETGFKAFTRKLKGLPVGERTPPDTIRARVLIHQSEFSGLLQGDLRRSYRYNEPVWEMMARRFPISTFYGILTILATYGICIPLGVVKAIRHRTYVDNLSSILIFMGYAIPGYALASVLLLVFGTNLGWFPISGFVSDNFAELGTFDKIKDVLSHAAMPLLCYLVGSFAITTMMVKNNLMENLAADYVRTAVSKGVAFPKAVVGHALRNSLIPIATTLGQVLGVFLMGSFIVEKIFDIDGFGLLGFNSALERDYMVTMGILTVSSLLMLLGNVLSDFLVALTDPRVSYH
jgi:microcin C transport system permease protein